MQTSPQSAVLYCDGASKGNPGPAGAGFVLRTPDGDFIAQDAIPLGRATNNVAEYQGLIAGLHEASARGIKHLSIMSDSELLVRQLLGQYRVRSRRLKPLYESARTLIASFASVHIAHIRREKNAEADKLADQAARRQKQGNNGRQH